MKKRVLGRGLDALIGEREVEKSRYMVCSVERIRPNKTQPRKRFDEKKLMELADSIREKGIIEPLIVRKDSLDFELIAGERRWRAAQIAGLKQVPIVIKDATDEDALELALIENIQREDLNPIEEAHAYEHLIEFGLQQEEVAKKVGKDRATVANFLRLLKLPSEVKDELIKETITMGHAKAILSLEGHAAQRELCKEILKAGLSVREAEKLASSWLKKAPKKKLLSTHLSGIEDELRKTFGTKVIVRERNGKGKIEIEFYSADERERVLELLRTI